LPPPQDVSRPYSEQEEGIAMTGDFLMVGALFVAMAIFGWAVVHMISAVGHLIPADDFCLTAYECVNLALGQ
jgi:hypothetical protein